jgi:hypothetical protein
MNSNLIRAGVIALLLVISSLTPAKAQTITVGTQCSRPGPITDNNCTVMYRVANNPANNIVCTWIKESNGLFQCEGRTLWGQGYDGVPPAGTTLEFRRHANWPTLHPSWPSDPATVRNSGTLLKSQFVTSRYRASPTAACSVTVSTGQSIQSAINAAATNATICLGSGIHTVGSTIKPKSGQTVRSASATSPATLRASTTQYILSIEVPGVTIKNLRIEGSDAIRPGFGVVVSGTVASNILLEGINISKALIGVGVTNGASNVELRQSEIAYAGDGLACSGCASPSIWINNSSDVRIMKSTLINNGASPEGDGELACYNTPGLVVHNSTVKDSGAAGMYLVNCDYAVVSGNDILSAGEWGIDLVDANQPSGTDYGLFSWNLVQESRHGAGVVLDSLNNTFQNNTYNNNRQGPDAAGSCNGINRRGNTSGYYYINDVASPWPVVCND